MNEISDYAALAAGHEQLKAKVDGIHEELRANSEVTNEIRDILSAARTGFKVVGWLGTFVKWAAGIGAAVTSLLVAWNHLHKP